MSYFVRLSPHTPQRTQKAFSTVLKAEEMSPEQVSDSPKATCEVSGLKNTYVATPKSSVHDAMCCRM